MSIIFVYIHTFFKAVLSENNPNLIAVIGGVIGGLVGILLIALLGFGIAAVTLGFRKRGEYIATIVLVSHIGMRPIAILCFQ